MSKNIVDFNKVKKRRESEEKANEQAARAALERTREEPSYKSFMHVMTPTPINPHNMPIVMKDVLFAMEQRLKNEQQDNPEAFGVFDMHLRLTGHTFDNAAMIECRDSFENDLHENDHKLYSGIRNKALRETTGTDSDALAMSVKDTFMKAMIGRTYAYRAVAKQLSEEFPGMSLSPALTPISPTECVPTIKVALPVREGHDLRAMLERYLYRHDNRNKDGTIKPPPHLKPV